MNLCNQWHFYVDFSLIAYVQDKWFEAFPLACSIDRHIMWVGVMGGKQRHFSISLLLVGGNGGKQRHTLVSLSCWVGVIGGGRDTF